MKMIVNKIKLAHVARSGNQADVIISDDIRIGCYDNVKIAWDHTHSPEDLREFNEEVWPNRIVPVVIDRLEKRTGRPHRAIPLGPGLYAFALVVSE